MEFSLLGPVQVVRDGRVLDIGSGKQRVLLALLACFANEVVATEFLVTALWPGRAPQTSRQNLRVYVFHLRRILGQDSRILGQDSRIRWQSPGYSLLVEPGELDLHRFEDLVAQGSQALAEGAPQRAASSLRLAEALWRGPALTDIGDVEAVQTRARRLTDLRLTATETRIAAELALGRHAALVPELRELTTDHPLREDLHAQLMVALARSGRQAEALAVYRTARQSLIEELGIEPGPTLRRTQEAVLRGTTGAEPQVPAFRTDAPDVEAHQDGPASPWLVDEVRRIRSMVSRLDQELGRIEAAIGGMEADRAAAEVSPPPAAVPADSPADDGRPPAARC